MSEHREQILVGRLVQLAAERLGFNLEAISRDALGKRIHAELRRGTPLENLLAAAQAGEDWLVRLACEAIVVGETFFFRHPEHFEVLSLRVIPERLAARADSIRAWSAGCASGEEAYSLAACLLATAGAAGKKVEVLGTDISERALVAAQKGIYGNWSRRDSGPLLHPLFEKLPTGKLRVLDSVRGVTSFAYHNLLDAPEHLGLFDVIFCRNVLVYFSPEAAQQVRSRLTRALLPGGYLFFGTMDVEGSIPGLQKIGMPGCQVFVAPRAPAPSEAPPRVPAARPEVPPAKVVPLVPAPPPPQESAPAVDPMVAQHLQALSQIEGGQHKAAERTLKSLRQRAPDYIPGVLELALLYVRMGNRINAKVLMQEVLDKAGAIPPEQVLDGPEPLPARFYWTSASAFFNSGRAAP